MTSAQIRTFCERFACAWEQEDVAALTACYADDCEVISPIFRTLRGRAEVEGSFRDLFKALTDYNIQVDDIIVDHDNGERAVLVWTAQSTHRGEIFGMPGTGRRIENQIAFIFRFQGDKIALDRRIYDFTRMLMQIGVLRAKTA